MKNLFAIVEIGSNNTKTHIYDFGKPEQAIYEAVKTIEFKANYAAAGKISDDDIEKLLVVIGKAQEFTKRIYVYGCSIFRSISAAELAEVNERLKREFNVEIEVVSQQDEAFLTAYGCYGEVDFAGNICVFIGGGGSIEIIIVNGGEVVETKFLDFGVVDTTQQFPSLRDDVPTCSFGEVQRYVAERIGDVKTKCEVLILAGGDHLYWYDNAGFELVKNTLYQAAGQEYMLTLADSDKYDEAAYRISLDKVRKRSDNPKWFDGSRAMKATTNALSHIVGAKYIVPTKINMEDGLKEKIINDWIASAEASQ
jgi:hypothetical protein